MKEQQLTELLHDMSLQEKIDQMFQVMGLFFTEDEKGTLTGPAQNFGVDVKDLQSAGTILGSYGADTLKAIQDKAMSVQPHHIPMLFMLDVIHGLKTVFPAPLAQGATGCCRKRSRRKRPACDLCAYGGSCAGRQVGQSYGIHRRGPVPQQPVCR